MLLGCVVKCLEGGISQVIASDVIIVVSSGFLQMFPRVVS